MWWPVLLFSAVFFPVFALALWIAERSGPGGRRARARFRRGAPAQAPSLLRDGAVSDIPILDEVLRPWPFLSAVERRLDQADLAWRPVTLLLLSLTAALVAGAAVSGLLTPNALVIGAMAVVCGALPYAYLLYRRGRRLRRLEAQLPEALDTVARALQAGRTLSNAIALVAEEMTGPLGAEFKRMRKQHNDLGQPFDKAVLSLALRVPLEEARLFAAAVLIQKESGGKLADILINLSQVVGERFKLQRDIRTVSAGGRLSGVILSALPIIVGSVMFLLSPDHMAILFRERIGHWMLGALAVAEIVGFICIRKITRIRV